MCFIAASTARSGSRECTCKVITGLRHDHLFVPVTQAIRAMAVLQQLQRSATGE
jgi:hypothetical protein